MTLRRLFLLRLLREKVLITLFLVIAAAIWISSYSKRAQLVARDWRRTTTELASQQLMLDATADIERRATEAVEAFDPSRTLDDVRLLGLLGNMAQEAGLANTTSGDARTERTPQFSVHSVQFTARRAELGPLLKFYDALTARAPYVGIEQCSIAADRANPALLTATLRVTAVEVVR